MRTLAELGVVIPFDATEEYRTICPLCSHERKKSRAKDLCINIEKGVWNCQHCLASGNIHKQVYKIPVLPTKSKSQSSLEKFFISRGISKSTYNAAGVYQSGERMAFPYYDGDRLVTVKFRGKNKTFSFEKDCELILYGVNDITENELIFVEGEIDYLSIKEIGLQNVVSVPNGAGTNLDLLSKYHEKLAKCKSFVIAVDNDAAGMKLRDELIRRLGSKKCKVVSFPSDCKDSNDVLLKKGKDVLRECIALSNFCSIAGIVTEYDIRYKVEHLKKCGLPEGVSTGWASLDEFYKILPEKLDVITGIPGSGKSCFLDSLITNLAKIHNYKTCIYSPEGFCTEEHMFRFICRFMKASYDRNHPKYLTDEQLIVGREFLNKNLTWIDSMDDDSMNLDQILDIAEAMILRKNIDGLVIDPWNNLEHQRDRDLSETEYIGKCLTRLKRFAVKNKLHIWVVAHPTKMQKDHKGEYGVVRPYDISGSANWWNKVDCAISIKRNYDNYISEIYIQKVKTSNIGKLGKVSLEFYHLYEDYKEIINEQY